MIKLEIEEPDLRTRLYPALSVDPRSSGRLRPSHVVTATMPSEYYNYYIIFYLPIRFI